MSGVGFFIVSEGEASVSVDGSEVATIGPGDHFGELALISEGERTATVTATTRLRCLVIAFWDFRRFAKENPDVSWALLQHLAGLLAGERERRAPRRRASGLTRKREGRDRSRPFVGLASRRQASASASAAARPSWR